MAAVDDADSVMEEMHRGKECVTYNAKRTPSGDLEAARIAEALKTNTTLKTLYLTGIGVAAAAALADALQSNRTLKELNLHCHILADSGLQILAEMLKTTNVSLVSLGITQGDMGRDGLVALADALKTNSSLQKLDLSGNTVDAQGAAALAEALGANVGLRALVVDRTGCGTEFVAIVLRNNKHLRALSLKNCCCHPEGAASLGGALQTNNTLQMLALDGNFLGDAGAVCIAEALKTNQCLRRLGLEGSLSGSVMNNNMGDSGAVAFADALRTNRHLHRLSLSRNNFGVAGFAALAEALKVNDTLESLNLMTNPNLNNEALEALWEGIQNNNSLAALALGSWSGAALDLDRDKLQQIRSRVKENEERKQILTLRLEGEHVCCYRMCGDQPVATLDVAAAKDVGIQDWCESIAESMETSLGRMVFVGASATVINVFTELSVIEAVNAPSGETLL